MEETSSSHAQIGNIKYSLIKRRLRAWLELEDLYSDILEAAEDGDRDKLVASIYLYISAASLIPVEKLTEQNWYDVAEAFSEIYLFNRPSISFPLLRRITDKKKPEREELAWEYPGRIWYYWLHMLAKEYGWSIEYVENLSITDGIALLEEILVEDQLEKEWQWGMSERSSSYDEATKKSKFIPLNRPDWMQIIQTPKPIQKVKIRSSELPVGLIIKWNTDTNEFKKPS